MSEIVEYSEIEHVKLDARDKKLLYELDFHSRDPYSKLAKRTGLSKQGVEYKLNNLIKKEVINGFYPVVNVPKLGFIYCRLLMTLQNAAEKEKAEIISYLKKHPKVFWLFDMQGPFDLLAVIWAKNLTEFKDFVEDVETRYGNFMKRKAETIATDVIHFRHRFLTSAKKVEEIHVRETDLRVTIDETDKKILIELTKNPRITLVDLATKLKGSAKFVAYRIKRLEKENLIEAYRPVINYSALGYTYYKVFINLNKVSKTQLLELKEYLRSHTLVLYLVEGIGLPGDLDIEIVVRSNKELFDFIQGLRHKFPKVIAEYMTIVLMNTLKVRYLPF